MSAANPALPADWHKDANDGFHGKITASGPFQPEKGRYHLYIGHFCPFAHRAYLSIKLKQLDKYADIGISVVRPFPKGGEGEGFAASYPGWRFNVASHVNDRGEPDFPEATEDALFGSQYLHQVYFKADPDYKGKYSVPVLWDKKLGTIVNNESAELLRDLQTGFNDLLPAELAKINLYPEDKQDEIDKASKWIQAHINSGVYKAGNASEQSVYEEKLAYLYAALNKLEEFIAGNGGPFVLGKDMTILDIQVYTSIVRFDPVYVRHFMCNLAEIRHGYPVLNNWLKGVYHAQANSNGLDLTVFEKTTNFDHIKANYFKSHLDLNPKGLIPLGPWPHVETGYEADWTKLNPGRVELPAVLALASEIQ